MSERPYKIIKDDPELTDYLNKLEAELAKAREDVRRLEKNQATHRISVVAYGNGEIELTYEHLETHDEAFITILRDDDVGDRLSKAIGPCVYWLAKLEEPHDE